MNAALYARVSTLDQHPENQIRELRAYAKRNNYKITKEYVEKMSGKIDHRPALNSLLIDARRGLFDTVIIWKIDRLGRSAYHMAQVLQEFQNLHIDFIITTLGIDTHTPVGKLVVGVLMQIAEFERELIRERTLAGLKRAASQGRRPGRPMGSRDKKPRRRAGYINRYFKEYQK